ncbi:antimicrobial peptide ABC transporter permease [Secundilactobacillus odoratitofui DSM 19909 = JCM 15043]|uniref:Antimicrobial peptide ABC transporter permease n=1 Tax=Secundilactobacillus odoratitofui DSM 19909 = JCM 15043 TaxID=1423776 RepID=A0A0R1M1K6_9LACO|nr:FtsX-like permease family protein [Secundilactobacillus odoratitofui]KRK98490.1 antimicrobial peptide ABC transporter permease [Secundilactobacillus odoratitofui DSM 19909 = JCM 15043]
MKPLTKNMWRETARAKGRFIAIILIIMLGVLIFVGVKAAGPSLNQSAQKTVTDAKLSDIQAISTTGFTQADVKVARQVKDAQVEAVKYRAVVGGHESSAVSLYGYEANQKQNRLTVRSGHLPRAKNQIVLDERAKTKYGYRLGQTYTFAKSAKLSQRQYRIVGFVDSPRYIENASRGSANVGDGTVQYFAYIPASQMNLKVATMLSIWFSQLQGLDTFSNTYEHRVNQKITTLKRLFNTRASQRTAKLQGAQPAKFAAAQAKLTQAKAQLKASVNQIGPEAVTQKLRALAKQERQLANAKNQFETATTTVYTWQNRNDLPGFQAYGDSSARIAAIANVFPVFFFLIAALITFTTVTRMVEEARGQIGTFKALGYTKWEIARNYLAYALTAGVLGTVLGASIGNASIPRIVLALYKNYIPLTWVVHPQWAAISLALLFALMATLGAAIIVVTQELREGPAALMRPKAPKSAKRILLERITPLWSRLSFNRKVSYRNLFRFKSRMWMTIIGIAGGTALILTGFGIQDSIGSTATKQYQDIVHYQATVRLAQAGQQSKADMILNHTKQYYSHTTVAGSVATVSVKGHQVEDANIYAPENPQQFTRYVSLKDTTDNHNIHLKQTGVVLTEKMANLLHVKVGDRVKLTTTDHLKGTAKVTAITKNYMGHFVYLSGHAYRTLFGEKPALNTLLVRLDHQSSTQREHLAHQLLNQGGVVGTSYTDDQRTTVSSMSKSLSAVVLIFIGLSGILSFVVLYNLTNINVSERIRELSTIKVLGFYDGEVTMYIVRENIILTLVGIVVGYGVGKLLTAYIMMQAATAEVIFPTTIHWPGYLTATALMLVFTLIVMLVTHRRLQRVDMIEALKSNE